MKVVILGSAAGGGVPQWNCRCLNCESARRPNSSVTPRTQSSAAISADGENWFLLNVSADVRQQIQKNRFLWPAGSRPRATPIAGCLLTDAEVDHSSGLVQLREGCRFPIYSTALVHSWLSDELPIARILAGFADREWIEYRQHEPTPLNLPSGLPSGLEATTIDVGRDVPRYVSRERADGPGSVVGLRIKDIGSGATILYAPGLPQRTSAVVAAAAAADLLLIDGTFWSDDEPRQCGIGPSSAREMGHVPVSGPGGTLDWLEEHPARYRAYVHINNTNPMIDTSTEEHRRVSECGIRVAEDGDEFELSA